LLISKVLLGSWSESEYSITLSCGIRLTMGWSVSESVSLKRRGLRIGVDGLKSGWSESLSVKWHGAAGLSTREDSGVVRTGGSSVDKSDSESLYGTIGLAGAGWSGSLWMSSSGPRSDGWSTSWQLVHLQSMSDLVFTACLYASLLIPILQVRCCHLVQTSHCKASWRGLTAAVHSMQLNKRMIQYVHEKVYIVLFE